MAEEESLIGEKLQGQAPEPGLRVVLSGLAKLTLDESELFCDGEGTVVHTLEGGNAVLVKWDSKPDSQMYHTGKDGEFQLSLAPNEHLRRHTFSLQKEEQGGLASQLVSKYMRNVEKKLTKRAAASKKEAVSNLSKSHPKAKISPSKKQTEEDKEQHKLEEDLKEQVPTEELERTESFLVKKAKEDALRTARLLTSALEAQGVTIATEPVPARTESKNTPHTHGGATTASSRAPSRVHSDAASSGTRRPSIHQSPNTSLKRRSSAVEPPNSPGGKRKESVSLSGWHPEEPTRGRRRSSILDNTISSLGQQTQAHHHSARRSSSSSNMHHGSVPQQRVFGRQALSRRKGGKGSIFVPEALAKVETHLSPTPGVKDAHVSVLSEPEEHMQELLHDTARHVTQLRNMTRLNDKAIHDITKVKTELEDAQFDNTTARYEAERYMRNAFNSEVRKLEVTMQLFRDALGRSTYMQQHQSLMVDPALRDNWSKGYPAELTALRKLLKSVDGMTKLLTAVKELAALKLSAHALSDITDLNTISGLLSPALTRLFGRQIRTMSKQHATSVRGGGDSDASSPRDGSGDGEEDGEASGGPRTQILDAYFSAEGDLAQWEAYVRAELRGEGADAEEGAAHRHALGRGAGGAEGEGGEGGKGGRADGGWGARDWRGHGLDAFRIDRLAGLRQLQEIEAERRAMTPGTQHRLISHCSADHFETVAFTAVGGRGSLMVLLQQAAPHLPGRFESALDDVRGQHGMVGLGRDASSPQRRRDGDRRDPASQRPGGGLGLGPRNLKGVYDWDLYSGRWARVPESRLGVKHWATSPEPWRPGANRSPSPHRWLQDPARAGGPGFKLDTPDAELKLVDPRNAAGDGGSGTQGRSSLSGGGEWGVRPRAHTSEGVHRDSQPEGIQEVSRRTLDLERWGLQSEGALPWRGEEAAGGGGGGRGGAGRLGESVLEGMLGRTYLDRARVRTPSTAASGADGLGRRDGGGGRSSAIPRIRFACKAPSRPRTREALRSSLSQSSQRSEWGLLGEGPGLSRSTAGSCEVGGSDSCEVGGSDSCEVGGSDSPVGGAFAGAGGAWRALPPPLPGPSSARFPSASKPSTAASSADGRSSWPAPSSAGALPRGWGVPWRPERGLSPKLVPEARRRAMVRGSVAVGRTVGLGLLGL